MKIAIGSDHGGLNLKNTICEYLKQNNYDFIDFGTHDKTSCNYPEIAHTVAKEVLKPEFDRGILICGTGLGMAISANKIKGVRAVTCTETYSAKMSRLHNDANILTMGERVVGSELALDIVDIWLKTQFEGGRHQIRVDMIETL